MNKPPTIIPAITDAQMTAIYSDAVTCIESIMRRNVHTGADRGMDLRLILYGSCLVVGVRVNGAQIGSLLRMITEAGAILADKYDPSVAPPPTAPTL